MFLDKLYSKITDEIGHNDFKLNTLGFSQGGPMLLRWLIKKSHKINSLILWGSDIPKDTLTKKNKSKWDSMNLKIVIGKHDEYISDENKKQFVEIVESYGLKYNLIEYDGSHKIVEEVLIKINKNL